MANTNPFVIGGKITGVDVTSVDVTALHEVGLELDFSDGKRRKYIKAGAAIAAFDALTVDEAETPDLEPTSAVNQALAGVAERAIADGSHGWVVVRGSGVSVKAAATVVAGAHAVTVATAGTLDDDTAAAANAIAAASGIGAKFDTVTSGGIAAVTLA